MGKGENAGNQHFLLFPQCFLPFPKEISIFYITFIMSSANAFNLDKSKILSFGNFPTFLSLSFCYPFYSVYPYSIISLHLITISTHANLWNSDFFLGLLLMHKPIKRVAHKCCGKKFTSCSIKITKL